MNLDLNNIAGYLLFGVIKNKEDLENKIEGQWQFRKNKTIEDVNNSIKKGLKLGSGKTEKEIECVALYLGDVFKKVR